MPVSNRFICVHGHFYQPPREDPWLEAIEQQPSAAPYGDWNERIAAECYEPNGAARLLDRKGSIKAIRNNYSSMSFNMGPTLLSWLSDHSPEAYETVRAADTLSAARFGGHGSALAQAYNHIIMPLANQRDKETQVRWGIADFRARFGRHPEGMWLPECAVDTATLEVLAAEEIKFTILSPYQAKGVRSFWQGREADWVDVTGAKIDTRVPYTVQLPSGRSIAIFFYDHTVSQAVAFEGLLNNGALFAERLLGCAERSVPADMPCLINIATDGESYGHHHRYGEMALAFALEAIEKSGRARLTNYGEFLEKFPPTMEVRLIEPSSWSCSHGVGRWERNCGCKIGSPPDWTQKWRGPLRDTLNWLRDTVAPMYEKATKNLLTDPWAARDAYVQVIIDSSDQSLDTFMRRYAPAVSCENERVRLLRLMEMQRHAQLMFTSCGWFFDDLSGIETVQLLKYAGRVMDLVRKVFHIDLEPQFLKKIEEAQSNVKGAGNGADLLKHNVPKYEHLMAQVVAQVCIREMFAPGERWRDMKAFQIEMFDTHRSEDVFAGSVRFSSKMTRSSGTVEFVVVGKSDFNTLCGMRHTKCTGPQALFDEFSAMNPKQWPAAMTAAFAPDWTFTLQSLQPEALRSVLNTLAREQREELRIVFLEQFEKHRALLMQLAEYNVPLPENLRQLADFAVNHLLRREIESHDGTDEEVQYLMAWVESGKVTINYSEIAYLLRTRLIEACDAWAAQPRNAMLLKFFLREAEWVERMPCEVEHSHAQNVFWKMSEQIYARMDETMQTDMQRLGQLLKVRVGAETDKKA